MLMNMHIIRRRKAFKFLASALLICLCGFTVPSPALAYNFLYVDSGTGVPSAWEPGTTITYYLDPGDAGTLTNDQALILLKEAMRRWEEVPNANVPHFEFGGYLPEDVTIDNYKNYLTYDVCYSDHLDQCATEPQRQLKTLIIFDPERQITEDYCAISGCGSVTIQLVFDGDYFHRGNIRQGAIVFGGSLLYSDVGGIVGTFVHELGHLLGLAHPSINQQLIIADVDGILDRSFYLPSMHTEGLSSMRANLNPDDIAGIQSLYLAGAASTSFGSIHGKILKADGTPVAFANVIARDINDPWCKAYSTLSSRRCNAPTSALCEQQGFADGKFEIDSLPAGSYTVEVEGFSPNEEDYVYTVAPGIFGTSLPGNAEFWNDGDAANEDPLAYTVISLAAGEVRDEINITLNDSLPNDSYSVMIPAASIPVVANTACVEDTTDWYTIAGTQPPASIPPSDSVPGGGCSLVVPRQ